jgi:hypothetical protein
MVMLNFFPAPDFVGSAIVLPHVLDIFPKIAMEPPVSSTFPLSPCLDGPRALHPTDLAKPATPRGQTVRHGDQPRHHDSKRSVILLTKADRLLRGLRVYRDRELPQHRLRLLHPW